MNKPKDTQSSNDENGAGAHASESLWVEGGTWEKVKESLTDAGMSEIDAQTWIRKRQSTLTAMIKRLPGSWIEEDANRYRITLHDDIGEWIYRPEGGLQPIDFAVLRPALSDPIDADQVGRAVLENRLAYDGHTAYYVNWVLGHFPWCCDSNGQPIASMIEEHGWACASRELAPLILNEQERHKAESARELAMIRAEKERCEAEAKKPCAVIAKILANPIKYSLTPFRRKVLAAIGDSPDGKLSRRELAVKVWGVRPSMITQTDLNNVGTTVCRINKDILDSGYTLSTDRDDLYGVQWVIFESLHAVACA